MKILLISGLPGSGKSTLANRYVREEGYIRLGSDTIRKEFFYGLTDPTCKYHPAIHNAVFEILYLRMDILLQEGKSVVLDAIHRNANGRRRVLEIAKKYSIQPMFIEIIASEKVLRNRIANRKEDPFDSEANLDVLEQYLSTYNHIPIEDWVRTLREEGFLVETIRMMDDLSP